jgi:hypothetical protein
VGNRRNLPNGEGLGWPGPLLVRQYTGLCRHITLSMLALASLTAVNTKRGPGPADTGLIALSLPEIRHLITHAVWACLPHSGTCCIALDGADDTCKTLSETPTENQNTNKFDGSTNRVDCSGELFSRRILAASAQRARAVSWQ